MRIATVVVGMSLAFLISFAAQAEVKKPVGTSPAHGLKMGVSRISKEDCGKKNGTIKDVIKSLCSSGQYCSTTKSDGTPDAECIDEKKQ